MNFLDAPQLAVIGSFTLISKNNSVSNIDLISFSENKTFLVTYVVDGDTLQIETGEKIRLICIDTPEKNEEYYFEAKDYLEELVLGKKIELIKDISEKDRYGRLLRYVFVDGKFVNEKVVERGYAKAYWYKPDTKFCQEIQEAENYAKERDRGIWEDENEEDNSEEESEIETENNSEINTQENCQCVSDLDCPDFSSHSEAQECYEYCFKITEKDFHRLDREKDGLACENS